MELKTKYLMRLGAQEDLDTVDKDTDVMFFIVTSGAVILFIIK